MSLVFFLQILLETLMIVSNSFDIQHMEPYNGIRYRSTLVCFTIFRVDDRHIQYPKAIYDYHSRRMQASRMIFTFVSWSTRTKAAA